MVLIGILAFKRPLNFGDSFPYWLTYIFPLYRLLDFSLGALLGWLYLNTSHKERGYFRISTMLEIFTIIFLKSKGAVMKLLSEDFSGTPYRILVILTSFLISMISAQFIVFVNRIFEKRKVKEYKGE